jgi:IS1 family transposase
MSQLKHTVNMNRLDTAKRAQIVRLLIEGMTVNSTVRTTGVSKVTILKLLKELGTACSEFQSSELIDLAPIRVDADEIWNFVHSKEKNVPEERLGEFGVGDVWLWTAVDAETKLIFSWHVGMRTPEDAQAFMLDVAGRVNGRFQLTTDGLGAYTKAVIGAFGVDGIDFAQLVKQYGNDFEGEKRYSPAVCTGCKKKIKMGDPDEKYISTSYVERTNLTLSMGNRRFTRLTNAHSKKIENHEASIALQMMYYNFGRSHETLTKAAGKVKTTPAMASGVADHVWSIEEIVSLLDRT